jgi:hypothetical protein
MVWTVQTGERVLKAGDTCQGSPPAPAVLGSHDAWVALRRCMGSFGLYFRPWGSLVATGSLASPSMQSAFTHTPVLWTAQQAHWRKLPIAYSLCTDFVRFFALFA